MSIILHLLNTIFGLTLLHLLSKGAHLSLYRTARGSITAIIIKGICTLARCKDLGINALGIMLVIDIIIEVGIATSAIEIHIAVVAIEISAAVIALEHIHAIDSIDTIELGQCIAIEVVLRSTLMGVVVKQVYSVTRGFLLGRGGDLVRYKVAKVIVKIAI